MHWCMTYCNLLLYRQLAEFLEFFAVFSFLKRNKQQSNSGKSRSHVFGSECFPFHQFFSLKKKTTRYYDDHWDSQALLLFKMNTFKTKEVFYLVFHFKNYILNIELQISPAMLKLSNLNGMVIQCLLLWKCNCNLLFIFTVLYIKAEVIENHHMEHYLVQSYRQSIKWTEQSLLKTF